MNHFSLLNLSPAFDLDVAALESAYFREQRLYHPDRFAAKPQAQRQQAMQRSVDINHAYKTLKNSLSRAQYLLHLQGIEVGTDKDNARPSQALLAEMMDLREQVSEAADAEALQKWEGMLKDRREIAIRHIGKAYQNQDWETMAQETLRLGYVIKTLETLYSSYIANNKN